MLEILKLSYKLSRIEQIKRYTEVMRTKSLTFREGSYRLSEKARINSAEKDSNLKYQFQLVEKETVI